MQNYQIITDSCCDLPEKTIKELGLKVIPLNLHFRGKTLEDCTSGRQLKTMYDALQDCYCLVQVNVFGNVIPDVSALRSRDIIVNYDPTAA